MIKKRALGKDDNPQSGFAFSTELFAKGTQKKPNIPIYYIFFIITPPMVAQRESVLHEKVRSRNMER
jgi:hypothetical protein